MSGSNPPAGGNGNEPSPLHENGQCVTPLVKRHKNDEADAEAICEAASRPTMRFVAVKTEEQQARGMLFRTLDLLVRQRTQTINALRGHLAEFGVIAPQGVAHVARPASAIAGPARACPRRSANWARFCSRRLPDSKRRSGNWRTNSVQVLAGTKRRNA